MSVQSKKEKEWKNKQQLMFLSERALHGNAKVMMGSARILKSSCAWAVFVKIEKAQKPGRTP